MVLAKGQTRRPMERNGADAGPYIHGQLIRSKGATLIQWRKITLLNKGYLNNYTSICITKVVLDLYLTLYKIKKESQIKSKTRKCKIFRKNMKKSS